MARTLQFKTLSRSLRRAFFLHLKPGLTNALEDYDGLVASGFSRERREFLTAAAALGLGAALLPSCAHARATTRPRGLPPELWPEPVDAGKVVVIGAGIAGLTAAYRLGQAGMRCELYEAQSRLGGRIFTYNRFNSEGMFCELGGELIDSEHKDFLHLAEELRVEVEDFTPGDAGMESHRFHFRGQDYYDKDLTAASGPLATKLVEDMTRVYKNIKDPVITYFNYGPDAPKFDRLTLEEYLETFKDTERWVREALSMAYLTEFGLDPEEQSSINLMSLLVSNKGSDFGVFGASDEAIRVKGGNSTLINALAKAIDKRVPIHLGRRLARIEDLGSKLRLTFTQGQRSQTVEASRVICTVPFGLLREIEGLAKLSLGPVKRKCIRGLGYGTNAKHMLGFKDRYWRRPVPGAPNGHTGYVFTDRPSQTFWDSSRLQPGNSGIMVTFHGGRAGLDPQRGSVGEILEDVEALYPGCKRHYDGNHRHFRWGSHAFSRGSYTCPRPGQYTEIIGSAREPELGGKLLFAGEHCSESSQGYMNGAVESANAAAESLIAEAGLKRQTSIRGLDSEPVSLSM